MLLLKIANPNDLLRKSDHFFWARFSRAQKRSPLSNLTWMNPWLLMVLYHLIDFCFDGGENKFIQINKFVARWIREVNNNRICFSKQQMKDAVSYLFSNCYFTVGPKIFCQIIGIPMGSDPAPFFANLFLYYYERRWMNELKGVVPRKKSIFRKPKI